MAEAAVATVEDQATKVCEFYLPNLIDTDIFVQVEVVDTTVGEDILAAAGTRAEVSVQFKPSFTLFNLSHRRWLRRPGWRLLITNFSPIQYVSFFSSSLVVVLVGCSLQICYRDVAYI